MRYELQAKSVQNGHKIVPKGGPGHRLMRPSWVERDPGREWSGDLFETDAPTDPSEAYAYFTGEPIETDYGPEDVEAWLDRGQDGMLVGWVRQGTRVWRYTDPDLWGLDVDGADMVLKESDDAQVAADVLDAVDSTAAGAEVDSLEDTDPSTVFGENEELEDDLVDATVGEKEAPVNEPVDEPAPVEDDQEPDADEDDDEDAPPWAKGGTSRMQKKTLRLVVHPKA